MYLFFSLLILEGIHSKPRVLWSKMPTLETPYFSKIMTEKRFSLMTKFLHFANNEDYDSEEGRSNPLKKIEILVAKIIEKFKEAYTPERDLSVDESLLLFKGRLSWKQYIPTKRARFGLKLYNLCESSSGYVINFMIYTGEKTIYLPEYKGLGTIESCSHTFRRLFR